MIDLTDATFDQQLRLGSTALVLFYATWCVRCKELDFARVARAFPQRGVIFARVLSDESELLDRFDISSYPTLLWFDGSPKWPFYAAMATPIRYPGPPTFESVTSFVERHSGQQRSLAGAAAVVPPESPLPEPTPPLMPTPLASTGHACQALSQEYVDCMRHWEQQPSRCAVQRRQYLFCMSTRWSVHPDEHQSLAAEYGRRFASS